MYVPIYLSISVCLSQLYYLVQATMSIGFGFPSEEDICNRAADRKAAGYDTTFDFSLAQYWVGAEHQYPQVQP